RAGLRVQGEQAQVIGLGRAGFPDEEELARRGPETAVPQGLAAGDLDVLVLAVGADHGIAPVRVLRGVGAGADAVSLLPGPAPLPRRRRLRPVQHRVGRQPRRPRCPLDGQGFPVERGVPRPVNRAASSTWEAVPLPRQSRNSTGSATGEGQNRSRTTIAATTQVLPYAVFFPP